MGGWLWPDTDYGWLAFLVLTILAAMAAIATGRCAVRSASAAAAIDSRVATGLASRR